MSSPATSGAPAGAGRGVLQCGHSSLLLGFGARFPRLGTGVVCDRGNAPDDRCSPKWPSPHHGGILDSGTVRPDGSDEASI